MCPKGQSKKETINMLTVQSFREFVGKGIFTVVFVKKDGTLRVMNARLGVSKDVKGTKPEATAKRNATLLASNMIGVYEMPLQEYRTINLNTVRSISANGITITIEGE